MRISKRLDNMKANPSTLDNATASRCNIRNMPKGKKSKHCSDTQNRKGKWTEQEQRASRLEDGQASRLMEY